jgi:hypothetical protein
MRIERSVTSVSCIPSEAVTGVARGAFAAPLPALRGGVAAGHRRELDAPR